MPNNSSKLISLMFIMGRRMRDEMRQYANNSGYSWLHFEAMRYIEENGKPTMRDIALNFSITPPAATLLVEGLATGKLLRRIVDPKDRRTVRVTLTPKGETMVERGIRERVKKIKEVFSVLNAGEYAELIRILEKVTKTKNK